MKLKKETKELQSALAKYCRDGREVSIEGSKAHRLPQYRSLVYNVMYGLQEKSFPILKSILTEAEFKSLLESFMENHQSSVPQVWRVPFSFFEYVISLDTPLKSKYPYLTDLMLMEWTEILVFNQEDRAIPNFEDQLPQLEDAIVLNSDYEIISMSYPVHKGDWENIEAKKGVYHLLLFRNLQSKKVHFVEISALHRQMLELMEKGIILQEIFQEMKSNFQLQGEGVDDQLMNFVFGLYNDGFVLGIR